MGSISSSALTPRARRLLGALAVAGGFIAGFYALGLSQLRPNEHWPWLALLAATVGGLPMPVWLRIGLWLCLSAFTTWQVIPPALFDDETWQPLVGFYATAIAGIVMMLGLGSTYERRPAVFVWVSAIVGGAGVLFWAGNALFAEMASILATALALAGILARSPPAKSGAIAVAAGLYPALLAAGALNNFSDVPVWVFSAAAILPVAVTLPFARPSSRG